jgi:predicted nucleic acid-binding protein
MWSHYQVESLNTPAGGPGVGQLRRGSPVVVNTDVCRDLATGLPAAVGFFASPPVEIRLATASYLALLGAADSAAQHERLKAFVQPYAVLSLGPMASSRAVALMLDHALANGLTALDALVAATALAHEIPLITKAASTFAGITGLTVCRPYD